MSRPKIVLLGMMTKMPVAGVIWQTIHYLVGLQRLGFDVYYAEDHGMNPSMFTDSEDDNGGAKAAAFIARTMARFDLGSRWSYRAWHDDGRYYGVGESELNSLFEGASAVINLHGGTMPRREHGAGGPLIFVGTDPVALEVELHEKLQASADFLDAHDAFFTFGENIGAADCKLPPPPARYEFHPTRQPVIVDFWQPYRTGAGERFTTVGNWLQPWREVTFNGEVYHWSKHHEFLKFLDLPQRTAQQFELALSSYEPADREMLEAKGWKVRHALDLSSDIDDYRQYIAGSRGEWTVAKDQNIRLRSGWFSDRSATYLAAGRPVITQETGFSNVLPTGNGLFGFATMDEIVQAVEQINSDYQRHSRGAYEIARECFNYDVVLPKLLGGAGVSLPNQTLVKRDSAAAQTRNGGVPALSQAPVAPGIPFVDGVNVIGYLRTESGVGEAGRGYVRALQTLDVPISLRDVSDLCGNRAEDHSLALDDAAPAYDVNLVCVDIEKHFGVLARFGEEFFDGRYNIGVWAWETQEFPTKWFDRFAYYDEVWVGTSFIADYLAPISPIPILRVPPVLSKPASGSREAGRRRIEAAADEFVFLFIFDANSTFHRKNPLATVEAFRMAFAPDENARLVFKVVNAANYADDLATLQRRADGWPISIHEGYWPAEEVRDLMAACDAYVSLHRSEGTGLTISDAMANGKPVIATGWSGNMDFMTHANSYPVRHEMIAIEGDSSGPYRQATGHWAEASLDHAAELMRHVFEHREEAVRKGELAKSDLARDFSAARTAEMIGQRLRAVSLRRRFPEFQTAMKQRYSGYVETVRAIRRIAAEQVPAGGTIAVASRGDEQLVDLPGREALHFPQVNGGIYAGKHPADSEAAIRQLERLRRYRANYFLIPNTMFWWFETYPEFKTHLSTRYQTVWDDESCVIYDLGNRAFRKALQPHSAQLGNLLRDVRTLRERHERSSAALERVVLTLRESSERTRRDLQELRAKATAREELQLPPPPPMSPEERKRSDYRGAVEQIRAAVQQQVPADSTLAVVSNGDPSLLYFEARRGWHFPRTEDGQWGGHHPQDSDSAIEHLEQLRVKGLEYFVLPSTYFWWLEHYTGFFDYLAAEYKTLRRDEVCALYDVREAVREFPVRERRRQQEEYQRLARQMRSEIRDVVPEDATLAITTLGDPELLNWEGRRAWHFPRSSANSYDSAARNDEQLTSHLEELRQIGLQYLLIPKAAFAWLEAFPEFKDYLAREYLALRDDGCCIIYSLRESTTEASQAEARAKRESYAGLVQRLREFVKQSLPRDAALAIVTKGDSDLLNLEGRRAYHFPRTPEGEYAGKHPPDAAAAIAELEALRRTGVTHFVLPTPYLWWLEFYGEFARHLQEEYKLIHETADCYVYDVRQSSAEQQTIDGITSAAAANIPENANVMVLLETGSSGIRLENRQLFSRDIAGELDTNSARGFIAQHLAEGATYLITGCAEPKRGTELDSWILRRFELLYGSDHCRIFKRTSPLRRLAHLLGRAAGNRVSE